MNIEQNPDWKAALSDAKDLIEKGTEGKNIKDLKIDVKYTFGGHCYTLKGKNFKSSKLALVQQYLDTGTDNLIKNKGIQEAPLWVTVTVSKNTLGAKISKLIDRIQNLLSQVPGFSSFVKPASPEPLFEKTYAARELLKNPVSVLGETQAQKCVLSFGTPQEISDYKVLQNAHQTAWQNLKQAPPGTDLFLFASKLKQAEKQLEGFERMWVNKNFETFTQFLCEKLPDTPLNSLLASTTTPSYDDFNNNGLLINASNIEIDDTKPNGTIDRDGIQVTLSPVKTVTIKGKSHTIERGYCEEYPSTDGTKQYMVYSDTLDARFHDRVLTSGGGGLPTVMTLTDGSGHGSGARPAAKEIAEEAQKHMEANIKQCQTLRDLVRLQLESLKKADSIAREKDPNGSTTYVQAAIVGNVLTGVAVGDSKALIFRPQPGSNDWVCIDPAKGAKGTLDPKDPGAQIQAKNDPNNFSDLHKIQTFATILQPGDVVFLASDGWADNFNPYINLTKPSDIDQNLKDEWQLDDPTYVETGDKYANRHIENVIAGSVDQQSLKKKLLDFIQKNTIEKKLAFLTADADKMKGIETTYPGKLDDAAMAMFTYQP